ARPPPTLCTGNRCLRAGSKRASSEPDHSMRAWWLLLALLVSAPSAEARTFWVSKSGNDSNACTDSTTPPAASGKRLTITAGLACGGGLGPGATLYVRAGTYDESFSFTVGIPSGTSWNAPVTLSAAPGEAVTILPTTGPCLGDVPCRVFEFSPGDQY